MNNIRSIWSQGKWRGWINPLLLLVSGYFLIVFFFSEEPFFIKSIPPVLQGEVPEVAFRFSSSLIWTLVFFVLFNFFLFQALRQWARYYLNRKLVLSYLLFAIVPLVTNIFIFMAGITTWMGLSNTFIIEKSMEMQARELENFAFTLQQELSTMSLLDPTVMDGVQQAVKTKLARDKDLSTLDISSVPLEIYWQTEKIAGLDQHLIPLYLTDPTGQMGVLISQDTESYERIYPTWMEGDGWTDIISEEDQLSIRHFSISESRDQGRMIVVASIPVNNSFLDRLREVQTLQITLFSNRGTMVTTERSNDSPWYLSLLLRPLASERDILALDWETGFYEEYGKMILEVEPAEIGRILNHQRSLNVFYGDEQRTALRFIIFMIVLLGFGVLIAIIFGIYLISYITRSLNTIALGHERVREGNLGYRLPPIGKDQLGAMGASFNNMASSIGSLMSQVAEKEKYQEELRIAREIQMSLLPDMQALKWCNNIAATCIPAKEVGGDYFEVLRAHRNEIGVFIADVSGKGTSAAFYMAELKGVLIALRHLWNDPEKLMLGMNEILQPALATNVFVSAAYLLLDPVNRKGKLARAGHCPAFHVQGDGDLVELLPPGMALGIIGNDTFGKILSVAEFDVHPRDKIVLYTDGLDEMTNDNEMYGVEKLKAVLKEHAHLDVEALKQAILDDVHGFMSTESQDDDLTLVVAGLHRMDADIATTAVPEGTSYHPV